MSVVMNGMCELVGSLGAGKGRTFIKSADCFDLFSKKKIQDPVLYNGGSGHV